MKMDGYRCTPAVHIPCKQTTPLMNDGRGGKLTSPPPPLSSPYAMPAPPRTHRVEGVELETIFIEGKEMLESIDAWASPRKVGTPILNLPVQCSSLSISQPHPP
jgi:hypothetical protein